MVFRVARPASYGQRAHAGFLVVVRPASSRLCSHAGFLIRVLMFAAACTIPSAAASQQPARSPNTGIVGYVSSSTSGEPLGLADVTVATLAIGTFAGSDGVFHLRNLPAGPLSVRVRRIGFRPATLNVVIIAGRVDTLRVSLAPVALELAKVHIADAVCPVRTGGDTVTLAILEQIRINAERNQLLAREFPFVTMMERTIADEHGGRALFGHTARRTIVWVDTPTVAGEHEWKYAPGKLIVPNEDGAVAGARDRMIVPQLVDFAGDPFINAHCFRYVGLSTVDGDRRIEVDFKPTKTIHKPDVHGSIYLDSASYQIVRTTLLMQRPSPQVPATDIWDVRVDTRFREILPALPVVETICMRTTGYRIASGHRRPLTGAAIEMQRLIGFEFENGGPGDAPRATEAEMPACEGDDR